MSDPRFAASVICEKTVPVIETTGTQSYTYDPDANVVYVDQSCPSDTSIRSAIKAKIYYEHVLHDMGIKDYTHIVDNMVSRFGVSKGDIDSIMRTFYTDKVENGSLKDIFETKISLEYHNVLNPKLWDGITLKGEVRDALVRFAKAWTDFAKIPRTMIKDIIITGGNANYNYTSKSDIDVHVIIDKSTLMDADTRFLDDYLKSKKTLWTLTHNVTVCGCSVEPYAQDISEKLPTDQGVYSIQNNTWISKPEHTNRDFKNDRFLKKKVAFYSHLINQMIKDKVDITSFESIKAKLRNMRTDALASGGEFGFDNLVFKELRNRGVLDKMNKYISDQRDLELSL